MISADFILMMLCDGESIQELKDTLSNLTLNNRRDEVKWR